jgi:hypothetical protein
MRALQLRWRIVLWHAEVMGNHPGPSRPSWESRRTLCQRC